MHAQLSIARCSVENVDIHLLCQSVSKKHSVIMVGTGVRGSLGDKADKIADLSHNTIKPMF